jgi:hypothetical protein
VSPTDRSAPPEVGGGGEAREAVRTLNPGYFALVMATGTEEHLDARPDRTDPRPPAQLSRPAAVAGVRDMSGGRRDVETDLRRQLSRDAVIGEKQLRRSSMTSV